ncbi:MAG: phosphate propanoyltransferase [Firmicutes bacterium]|nr:phosphate propanoyltransferase [Bacillota bacterium]
MVESVLNNLGAVKSAGQGTVPAAQCGTCCCDPFPVEVSARHVHLTREAVDVLFGAGHQLGKKKMLSQPGEFLSEERVKLVTPKGQIDNVAVLGPERKAVQVELSATDAKSLGLKAPVNLSGDLSGAADVVIIGPNGILKADGSVIIAKAHLHLTPADAQHYGLRDGQIISVRIDSPRPITLNGVVARVRSDMALAMHIDFDEANAGSVGPNATGTLCGIESYCSPAPAAQAVCQPAAPQPFLVTKKLITEEDAKQLKEGVGSGGCITIPKGTLVTPAARDVFNGSRITVNIAK